MTCVVAVFVSMLSLSAGFMHAVHNTGRSDRALILSRGATFEFPSALQRDALGTIADAPGVARHRRGQTAAFQ